MVHVTGDDAGFYDLELAAANVNYVGSAMLAITDAATHCPVFHELTILPAVVYDSLIGGTDNLQVDVIQNAGTAITAAAGIQEVKVASMAANALTATAIAADAITAAKVAADVTTEFVTGVLTTQMTEAYAADGVAPTLAQALFLLQQQLGEFSISGTTLTVKKLDGSTTAATFTLNSSSSPTSITRT
jgi:hypothetical protein